MSMISMLKTSKVCVAFQIISFLPRNLESEHIMMKIQLEKGLIQASSFDEWEENLINLHPNLSNEIQNIFNRY